MMFSTLGSFNTYILFENSDGLWLAGFEFPWFSHDELAGDPDKQYQLVFYGRMLVNCAGLRQLLGDLVTMRTFCKAMLLIGTYFLVAVLIFSNLEGWNWMDVVYFSIITLMTVAGCWKSHVSVVSFCPLSISAFQKMIFPSDNETSDLVPFLVRTLPRYPKTGLVWKLGTPRLEANQWIIKSPFIVEQELLLMVAIPVFGKIHIHWYHCFFCDF